MHAELTALDGSRAGEVRQVRKDFATMGRHPSADIRFDPEQDLDVSGRHAALFRQGETWVLRDLGSTNGTYVNEARIRHDRVLAADDVIRLGTNGPRLRFSMAPSSVQPSPIAEADAKPTAPTRARATASAGMRGSRPTARGHREAARTQRRWRGAAVLATVLLLSLTGLGFAWRRTRALEHERVRLLRQLDSLTTRLDAATGSATALAAVLRDARDEAARLRRSVTDDEPTRGRLAALGQELSASRARHQGVLRAAELDVAAVARARLPAIALIVAELPGGRLVSGTGLTVRARGDTGWILTSRHLVVDSAGGRAVRLGAMYHGTAQNFRARVVATADSTDLALLAVQVRGGVPEAGEIATGAAVGDPVAILGYPFGFDFPMAGDWRSVGVSATTFSGTVTRVTPGVLELDGYGATGSSGSPVFDAGGAVVGLVFGGDPGSQGRTLYAVPANVVRAFLTQHGQ
jgi:S1-C subfamily serine protease